MRTVGDLKDSVSGLLQGLNLDNVTGLYKAFERAARTLSQKASVPEASEKQSITLYGGVYDYLAPSKIFGSALIDFRPQGISRSTLDYVYRKSIQLFDRTKAITPNGYDLTFEHNKGVPLVRVATPKTTPRVVLDLMNDDEGWTAGGSASNIIVDESIFYDNNAALRFALTGASTGTLTKAINAVDISSYEDLAVGFLAIRTPSVADLTNISVQVGSSDSAYDEVTATQGFLGSWVVNEWLLVAFDFSGATSVGTPDWGAISHIKINIAHTASIVNFRIGGFWLSLPSAHEMVYKTAAIYLEDGALQSTITDEDTEIILNDASYTLYEFESAVAVAEGSSGGNLDGVALGYKTKLEKELYPTYRADNPSGEIRQVGNYLDD